MYFWVHFWNQINRHISKSENRFHQNTTSFSHILIVWLVFFGSRHVCKQHVCSSTKRAKGWGWAELGIVSRRTLVPGLKPPTRSCIFITISNYYSPLAVHLQVQTVFRCSSKARVQHRSYDFLVCFLEAVEGGGVRGGVTWTGCTHGPVWLCSHLCAEMVSHTLMIYWKVVSK